jgi:hypothetical protein
MNRFFLVLSILVLFILPLSRVEAEITGLKAELEGLTRSRTSFPDLDGISFSVKVTNTSSKAISGAEMTARIPKSIEYAAGEGIFGSYIMNTLEPNQSTIVILSDYLIPRSKKLSGKIEFVFDDKSVSMGGDFKNMKVFSSKVESKPLPSFVDNSRSSINIKYLPKDTLKKYSKDTNGAKLFSLRFKSSADMNISNFGFTYLSQKIDLNPNELTNLTLWSGGIQICGTEQLSPGFNSFFQNEVKFSGCSIDLEKNKIKEVSLLADISKNIPKDAIRNLIFSSYSIPQNVDIYGKNLISKNLNFK